MYSLSDPTSRCARVAENGRASISLDREQTRQKIQVKCKKSDDDCIYAEEVHPRASWINYMSRRGLKLERRAIDMRNPDNVA